MLRHTVQTPIDHGESLTLFLDSLDRPDAKIFPILFAAKTLRDMGAKNIGLAATYLAYMRQDKMFNVGETVSSKYFAEFISDCFDWMVTVDPHLHRYNNLNEIYKIPSIVCHAAPFISSWIKSNVKNPVLIGPDSESEQWVSVIAKTADAPYLISNKIRYDDQKVEVSIPDIQLFQNRTPVLVDDIISTAQTMIEAIRHLETVNMPAPICIGVHAIFVNVAYASLQNSGASQIVTCNTVSHQSNQIDISEGMGKDIQQFFHF